MPSNENRPDSILSIVSSLCEVCTIKIHLGLTVSSVTVNRRPSTEPTQHSSAWWRGVIWKTTRSSHMQTFSKEVTPTFSSDALPIQVALAKLFIFFSLAVKFSAIFRCFSAVGSSWSKYTRKSERAFNGLRFGRHFVAVDASPEFDLHRSYSCCRQGI